MLNAPRSSRNAADTDRWIPVGVTYSIMHNATPDDIDALERLAIELHLTRARSLVPKTTTAAPLPPLVESTGNRARPLPTR